MNQPARHTLVQFAFGGLGISHVLRMLSSSVPFVLRVNEAHQFAGSGRWQVEIVRHLAELLQILLSPL